MKKVTLFLLTVLTAISLNAQKVWLSGKYANGGLTYIKNGEDATVKLISDLDFVSGIGLSVYGEFKYDNNKNLAFLVEKSEAGTNFFNSCSVFSLKKYKCPLGAAEGVLKTTCISGSDSNPDVIDVVSFSPIADGSAIWVWGNFITPGIKVCEGKYFQVYYIYSFESDCKKFQRGAERID